MAKEQKSPEGKVEQASEITDFQLVAAVVVAAILVGSRDDETVEAVLASAGILRDEYDSRLALVTAHKLQERGLIRPEVKLPELMAIPAEEEEAP